MITTLFVPTILFISKMRKVLNRELTPLEEGVRQVIASIKRG
jgi:hypothetical protein